MIHRVAEGFGILLDKVVFVGGAVMELYVTDGAAPESRPTEDIDCLINARSAFDLYQWEQELLNCGFKRRPGEGDAAWRYDDIRVNIAPVKAGLLGYFNRWYDEGVFHAHYHHLPSGRRIRIFEPAYFFAAKLEALRQRGNGDLRFSEDFEDIIYLLDNRPELPRDLVRAFHEVRSFIQQELRSLLRQPDLEEGLYYALPFGAGPNDIARLTAIIEGIAGYEPSRAFAGSFKP